MSDGKTAPRHSERVADCIDGIMARKDGSMTDSKTATELLREMLDERGVEWTYGDGTVSFNNGERWFHVWGYSDNKLCASMGYLTPEQAIAATLDSDDARAADYWHRMFDEHMRECATLRSRTLTAEQVRNAIFAGSTYASYDGSQYYADGINMQAIANELNFTLGSDERTYKPIVEPWESDKTKYDAYCGNCNYPLGDGELEPWNYCPNCGKAVKR